MTQAMVNGEPLTEGQRKFGHAVHATIVLTFVGGPESLYTVAVAYNDGREVDELTFRGLDHDTAKAKGNELWARFNHQTIAQALDTLPTVSVVQPAAELISEATVALTDATAARKLPLPQQRAILAAVDGVIARRDVATVKTLYSLADKHLGDLVHRGRYTVDHLVLNDYGQRIRRALADLHVLAA